jgi:hypothetical protein
MHPYGAIVLPGQTQAVIQVGIMDCYGECEECGVEGSIIVFDFENGEELMFYGDAKRLLCEECGSGYFDCSFGYTTGDLDYLPIYRMIRRKRLNRWA